jgi:hypothetical protein
MYSGPVAKSSRADILSALTEPEVDQVRAFVADLLNRRNIGATAKVEKP